MPNRGSQWAHGSGVNFEGGSAAINDDCVACFSGLCGLSDSLWPKAVIGPKSPAGAASLGTNWVGFNTQCDCRLMGLPAIPLLDA